jgi:hypothetical protein
MIPIGQAYSSLLQPEKMINLERFHYFGRLNKMGNASFAFHPGMMEKLTMIRPIFEFYKMPFYGPQIENNLPQNRKNRILSP